MKQSEFFPARGAKKTGFGRAHHNQPVPLETIGAIYAAGSIGNVAVGIGVNAPLYALGNKGAARLLLVPFAARFKAALRDLGMVFRLLLVPFAAGFKTALFGILAALALCFPVGALEPPPLGQKGEKVTAAQCSERKTDAQTEKKTDNGRLQELGEERSWIHQVTFCAGFVIGLIAGVGLIYTIIWIIATIWR